MQRYGSFGKWAKVLGTFARGCGDRGGNLRQSADEGVGACRKAVTKNARKSIFFRNVIAGGAIFFALRAFASSFSLNIFGDS